jgi:hypothetical protein
MALITVADPGDRTIAFKLSPVKVNSYGVLHLFYIHRNKKTNKYIDGINKK